MLLDGLALLVTGGLDAAAPALRQATIAFTDADIPMEQLLRWGWMAQQAAVALWDDDGWRVILLRQVQLARDVGALDQLSILLAQMAFAVTWSGDFAAAASLIAEDDAVCEATGSRIAPYPALLLASLRGRKTEAASLIQSTIENATAGGQGVALTWAHWVAAVLYNGLGRYADALAAAGHATEHVHPHVSPWALPELIEAATRTGNARLATGALERLADVYSGRRNRLRAGHPGAFPCAAEPGRDGRGSVPGGDRRLGRTKLRPELARAHLLYGEWLRRENRGADAREQLRTAHDMLAAMGMEAFAERARHELAATGETVRRRTVETAAALSAQEAHIARLAVAGRTNPEIGAQLFISARTVEWHLRKIFAKLGISSRRELREALPAPNNPTRTPRRRDRDLL